jgi:hypothetical protein
VAGDAQHDTVGRIADGWVFDQSLHKGHATFWRAEVGFPGLSPRLNQASERLRMMGGQRLPKATPLTSITSRQDLRFPMISGPATNQDGDVRDTSPIRPVRPTSRPARVTPPARPRISRSTTDHALGRTAAPGWGVGAEPSSASNFRDRVASWNLMNLHPASNGPDSASGNAGHLAQRMVVVLVEPPQPFPIPVGDQAIPFGDVSLYKISPPCQVPGPGSPVRAGYAPIRARRNPCPAIKACLHRPILSGVSPCKAT